jgi:hypothetical protein
MQKSMVYLVHLIPSLYFRLLPSGQPTVTPEEAAMLAAIFAEEGELPARPAGASTWSSKSRS